MKLSVAVIGHLIEMAKQRGQNPVEIHMCRSTIDAMQLAPPARDNRSPLLRMLGPKPQETSQVQVCGLPVIENQKCAAGVIALRDEIAMGSDSWMEEVMAAQGGQVPWLERTAAVDREVVPDAPVSIQALASSPGEASVSDCLMKSFDGIDKVQDIIVIRCMKNGNMEMSGTLNKMEMMGALQIAMSFVMHG